MFASERLSPSTRERVLRIYQDLADADKNTFSCQRDLLICHIAPAEAHKSLKRVAEAQSLLDKAKQLAAFWTEESQGNASIQAEPSQHLGRCAKIDLKLSKE